MKFLQQFLYSRSSGDELFQFCLFWYIFNLCLHFWRTDLLGTIFFFDRIFFFLSILEYITPLSPGLQSLYWEVPLNSYGGELHVVTHFSLVAFKIPCVFDHRQFTNNVISRSHCRLSLFGILCASWIWMYISHSMFGKCSTLLFQTYCLFLFLFSYGTPIIHYSFCL